MQELNFDGDFLPSEEECPLPSSLFEDWEDGFISDPLRDPEFIINCEVELDVPVF